MAERNLRKTRVGKVVSNKMDKTIVLFLRIRDGDLLRLSKRLSNLCLKFV